MPTCQETIDMLYTLKTLEEEPVRLKVQQVNGLWNADIKHMKIHHYLKRRWVRD